MTVVPFPADKWTWESARGLSRAVRVSPHVEAGLLTVSFWRDDRCAGTVRLTPTEAASLVGRLTAALAGLAEPRGIPTTGEAPLVERLAQVEQRLRILEEGAPPPPA
ncbi:hypothetical protein [Trujillonella endophytica]|uniref:Uncharacterized protein n=1 Tax=Trujillonella endophytica TaxID=673521 RepID=A0A1H8SEP7_9ACTN|nr:hypothetical protein [Trujillella endophytica]SEO77141.1 hypothetical protein SAMN05660991_01650 [Trujillella endophytica]